MPETTLTIRADVGLHARPAAVFVNTAKQFVCDVRVCHGKKEANAKSILGVLSLGVEQDDQIIVRAEGDDATEALEALTELVEKNFELEEKE